MYVLAVAAVLAATPPNESSDAGHVREVPLAVQVAREILTPELWDRTVNGIVAQYAAQVRAMAQQKGGTVDAGLEATLRRLYDELTPYSWAVDLEASLLQKHFTEAELVQLRDLYRSPLGMKMRDRFPEIQQDAVGLELQKLDMERIGKALRPHFHAPSTCDDSDDAPPNSAPASAAERGAGARAKPGG
jgi:hypothetical protein